MTGRMASSNERAFAVVLTVVLLALLVGIALAVSYATRSNTSLADAKIYQGQARQNALLGLRVALGELQRHAGPDQRTTATGNIRRNADKSVTQDPLTDIDAQKYWTGVWDENAIKLTWLVSGAQIDDGADIPNDTPDHPSIRLVGAGSLGTGTTMAGSYVNVQADPIKIEEKLLGHYGYWIGDEGVKVSAAVLDTIGQIDYSNGNEFWSTNHARLRQMVLSRPYIETIFGTLDNPKPDLKDRPNPYDEGVQSDLQKIFTHEQISLVKAESDGSTPFSSGLGRNFFNVTLLASNVHSDPVRGRLKQDISSSTVAASLLTTAQKGWLDTRPTNQPNNGLADYMITADIGGMHIAPVLTEFQVRIGFKRDTTTGNLNIKTQIQAELWNPYNANLLMNSGGGNLEIRIKGLPTTAVLDFKSNQPSIQGISIQSHVDAQQFILSSESTLSKLSPGQIVTVSGGATLSSGNKAEGVLSDYLDADGDFVVVPNGSPKEMTIRDILGVTVIQVELRLGGQIVAVYSPNAAFAQPTEVVQSSFNTLAKTKYAYGWGFSLRDDIQQWSDGSISNSRDPRVTDLTGEPATLFEPFLTTSGFSSQPTENAVRSISTASSSGVFSEKGSVDYVLFELPQRSSLTIANLQHVISDGSGAPNSIGNPWGGDGNALFDRAYFSGLPQNYRAWTAETLSQAKSVPTDEPAVASIDGSIPTAIPNSFLSLGSKYSQIGKDVLLDGTQNARYLMQIGGFNINSTSPSAWLAMLNGNEITDWRYRGPNNNVKSTELRHAYFRFPHSGAYSNFFDSGFSDSSSGSNASRFVQGVRDIPESSMKDFARAVVREIRAHGRPFPSIQAFLNDGVIDRAIAAAELNKGGARGSPYFLTQADVVSLLGPALASRSDTFRIRAYGDAMNPADEGVVEATPESVAYCEAMVQRTPDMLDPARPELGRRFVITYFRWLGPDDI